MKLGTNERVRLGMVVRTPPWSAGADGGRALVERVLADTGFRDVRVYLPDELTTPELRRALEIPIAFPEWRAVADATWGAEGAELTDDLGELRVVQVTPAPAPKPPSSSPTKGAGWVKAAVLGGLAIGCAVLAWALDDRT